MTGRAHAPSQRGYSPGHAYGSRAADMPAQAMQVAGGRLARDHVRDLVLPGE